MELRVRKPDGWTTVEFPEEVEAIAAVGGQVDGQLCLTLTGEREDGPRVVRTGILDVDEDDESLLEGAVPRTDDGTSVVLKQLLSDCFQQRISERPVRSHSGLRNIPDYVIGPIISDRGPG